MSIQLSNGMTLAPLRSLDDFIWTTARFQLPQFSDLEKWNKRVIANLLYYQTNYFLLSIITFLLIGFINPHKMALGIVAMIIAVGVFSYANSQSPQFTQFKTHHPFISLILIFGGGYFIVYWFESVVVFLFGILLPIVLTFLHASMRTRNIRNKITNKLESVNGLNKTPMGMLLNVFDSDRIDALY